MPTDPDHTDAWNVAHTRRDESNLARAYIDLRDGLKEIEHLIPDTWTGRQLKAAVHSNDT